MAALAADINVSTVGTPTKVALSANAADTFYQGAIVFADVAAGGCQVTWAAGDVAIGICAEQTVTAAADDEVPVYIHGNFWLPLGASVVEADEGDLLVLDADGTATDNVADMVAQNNITIGAGDIIIGRIVRVTSAKMLIHISPSITGMVYSATLGWVTA